MALSLNIEVCSSSCDKLLFSEITGAYTTSNTGGWNSPNPSISSATTAVVDITTPDNLTYTFNLFTSGFPTVDKLLQYQILSIDLGYSNVLPDGKYTITYSVLVSSTTYSVTKVFYNTCNAQCCVNKMLDSIDFTCDCSKDLKDKYIEAYTVLLGLKHAAICGNENDFNSLLNTVNNLCANSNCKNCK